MSQETRCGTVESGTTLGCIGHTPPRAREKRAENTLSLDDQESCANVQPKEKNIKLSSSQSELLTA